MSSDAKRLPAQISPIIFGCTGLTLDADEIALFRDASPAGFILFKKNCDTPEQTTALVNQLRETVGWRAPVLIDQEGGRVQRLRPPHWPDFPPPRFFGDLYKSEPDKACAQLKTNTEGLACVQGYMGIDVNCIPVLDVVPDDNNAMAINDRGFASNPDIVAALGIETCRAAINAQMTPVMKHIPGHGRAIVDSHFELPKVTATRSVMEATDWLPFKKTAAAIDNTKLWGMTAHVIYTDLDPDLPATLSGTIIENVIRKTIGFEGLLLTDDLFMEALGHWGDIPARAALSLKAGCDLALHCHGDVLARAKALESLPDMRPDTRKRLEGWHNL